MQRERLKRKGRYSSLLLPVLIALVSGCASTNGDKGTDPDIDPVPDPSKAEDTNFLLYAENASDFMEGYGEVLNDKDKLRELLGDHADNPGLKLKQLIQELKVKNETTLDAGGNGPGISPFRGLGGGYFHSLLDAAEGKINQTTDEYEDNPATVGLSGSIVGYTFVPKANFKKGRGTLAVDTYQTVTKNGAEETVNYLWDIRIKPQGYRIRKIVNLVGHPSPDDPDAPNPVYPPDPVLNSWNPFPGTLFFDIEMKKRIWKKGYNVKLHARGPQAIKVKNVWRDGAKITMGDPEFRPLLKTGKESCVDMFLRVAKLADGTPDLTQIPQDHDTLMDGFYYSYCLGRCAHPAIINSR